MKKTIIDRVDNITGLTEEYASITPPIPKSVKIELTARCDLKCFFCATGNSLKDKGDMPLEEFKRLAKEIREAGVEELGVFYLGESLLYKDLAEAIRYAKEELKYPYVFLTTNGRLATTEKIESIMKAGLDSLKFSFNNADEEQFAHVTRVAGNNHRKIIDNIKNAKIMRDKKGYDCGIFASSIKYNGEQQIKMEKAVEEIIDYVDEHYWLPLYGQAGLTAGNDNTKPVAGNTGRLDNMRDALPCWSIFTEGHITYDSKLSACCFDHDGRFNMADLKKTSFKDGWVSKIFQNLRAANLKKDVKGTACENQQF